MYIINFGGKNMHLEKCKKAFTLAETLLTITIIGVIAALTIPSMKSHSEMNAIIAQTQKAYLTAQSATKAIEAEHGDLELWPWATTATINNYFKSVMNVVPDNAWQSHTTKGLSGNAWSTILSISEQPTTMLTSWPLLTKLMYAGSNSSWEQVPETCWSTAWKPSKESSLRQGC